MTHNSNDQAKTGGDSMLEQTLVFRAGEELFGISLKNVLEVFQPSAAPVPVPGAPTWIQGIIHHQGEVLAVVRADALLGTKSGQQKDNSSQLILLDLKTQKILLQVDTIVALESIQSGGPLMSDGNRRAWLKGKLLTILVPKYFSAILKKKSLD